MRLGRSLVVPLVGLALLFFISFPGALLFGPPRIRDYAYRELAYRVIVDEVTKDATSDAEIAESLLTFVATHEYKTNANVLDRTVFSDLVRGIGWCDQQAWGLSTLLAKKGIPSSMLVLRGDETESHHTVATAFLAGKWRILDPFYGLVFYRPSGNPAVFDDLSHPERHATLFSPKRDAIEQYDPTFSERYFRLFDSQNAPTQWTPLTEKKDLKRRVVTRTVDFYAKLLGRGFVERFQDAYLRSLDRHTPDRELFLRARHYDLFFRKDLALASYQALLNGYPESAFVENGLYFLGRLQVDRRQWTAAAATFDVLLSRFGERSRWAGLAHYFTGLAHEAAGDLPRAVRDYKAAAPSTDFQVDWYIRLMTLGAMPASDPISVPQGY